MDERPVRALAWMARSLESALAELELSLPQYRLLSFLDQGDWAASVLADRLAVSRPSITSLADGLVAKGLVARRVSDEDRRRVLHELTPAGAAALGQADAALGERLGALLDRLDSGDRRTALAGLEALDEALARARHAAFDSSGSDR